MKLKVFYFLIPVLVAANLLTFCTKEPNIADAQIKTTQLPDDQGATDRTHCTVTVTCTSGAVSICGTNQTLVQCGTNYLGNPLVGTQILTNGQVGVYSVQSPSSIIVTGLLNNPQVPRCTVATSGGSVVLPDRFLTGEVYFDDITCQPHAL